MFVRLVALYSMKLTAILRLFGSALLCTKFLNVAYGCFFSFAVFGLLGLILNQVDSGPHF